MKQYTITQHPFKATLEFDDQWLVRFDIGEPEMQEIADGLDDVLKKRAVTLHALAAQQDASREYERKIRTLPRARRINPKPSRINHIHNINNSKPRQLL